MSTPDEILEVCGSPSAARERLKRWASLLCELNIQHAYGVYPKRLPEAGYVVMLSRHDGKPVLRNGSPYHRTKV